MPTSRSSVSIEASPEVVLSFLADLHNLTRFVPSLRGAEALPEGTVRVTIESEGEPKTCQAWVKEKEGRKPRIEWGLEGPHAYHGWVEIDREGDVASVTAELHSERLGREELDAALDGTLWALKQEIEAEA